MINLVFLSTHLGDQQGTFSGVQSLIVKSLPKTQDKERSGRIPRFFWKVSSSYSCMGTCPVATHESASHPSWSVPFFSIVLRFSFRENKTTTRRKKNQVPRFFLFSLLDQCQEEVQLSRNSELGLAFSHYS